MLLAMFSRPKVCVRLVPVSLLWFLAYSVVRVIWGMWQAPQLSQLWWPSSLELLQYLLPWAWLMFNVLRYPNFGLNGLWALVIGVSICALLHMAGIGVEEVDNGIEGRSSIFGLNANETGRLYGLTFVAVVALGLFRQTKAALRLALLPAAALLAITMAKTGSRGGTLVAALGVLILLPQTRSFVPRMKRYVALLLLAVVFAGVMYQIPTVLKRLKPDSSATQDEPRGRMIPVMWEMFLRSPVIGSGPDRYQYELTRRALPYQAEKQHTVSSHNLALMLLVETGIIGFAIFAIGLGKALVSAWRARGGPLGLLPLAWLLPVAIAGLTVANGIFEPLFWFAVAYALAAPALIFRPQISQILRGHNSAASLQSSCVSP
jgi:O-antigen ligase